jgi:hypothetical protein
VQHGRRGRRWLARSWWHRWRPTLWEAKNVRPDPAAPFGVKRDDVAEAHRRFNGKEGNA